jgi:putative SOS response-associated peptidase YedK
MCGRYDLNQSPARLKEVFRLDDVPLFEPDDDIRPTDREPVVRVSRQGGRECLLMRWGLVPYWAKDIKVGGRSTFNARAESIATSAMFGDAFRRRRCLVPASSFYEWKQEGTAKIKYRIGLTDADLFAFAGLWEAWRDDEGEKVLSFTIITTEANALLRPIHAKHRMPAILVPEHYEWWLDPADSNAEALLQPFPAERMYACPV